MTRGRKSRRSSAKGWSANPRPTHYYIVGQSHPIIVGEAAQVRGLGNGMWRANVAEWSLDPITYLPTPGSYRSVQRDLLVSEPLFRLVRITDCQLSIPTPHSALRPR
jgi:hypothetical protein